MGLEIDCELVEEILVRFLRNEIRKVGFERGVVGLSGGVDSTTSVFLAARALGPENVLTVSMPYKSSSADSRAHAEQAARSTGVGFVVEDITPQVDAYLDRHPDASQVRRGNKMARERMSILYDYSAKIGGLVIGTSNKTELLLGYGTQFGDMASAVNPLGDLYKTQVRALARYLGVPEEIVGKAPTADLWKGQTDEGELGFTYEQVDRLLYLYVDRRLGSKELEQAGFDPDFVARIIEMVRGAHYKRRPPVIAKVSERTIERDFRYSRDWGY